MKEENHEEKREKITVSLDEGAVAFIDKISKEVYLPSGCPVSTAETIEALVEVLMQCSPSLEDTTIKAVVIQRMLELLRARGEKRKFIRLKKSLIAGFRKMESMDTFAEGITEDISIGGFKLEVPYLITPLSCGQLVEIGLKDTDGTHAAVKGIGRVAWLKRKDDGAGFEVGVMLTHVREQDKARFQHYLQEESNIPQQGK